VKRFEQIPARSALDAAARYVLGHRLARLGEFADALAENTGDGVEAVHQLRVYCRRVHAAADVLVEALPKSQIRKLRKRITRIRRAGGRVRDWDVLAMELQAVRPELDPEELPAADYLLKVYPRRRRHAFDRLSRRLRKIRRKGFWDWVKKRFPPLESVEAIPSAAEHERSLADLARDRLPAELDAFLAALSAEFSGDFEQLHNIRIAAKRLRYVLEVFAGCFPAEYRQEIYNPIKRVQESLGAVNDAHTFAQQFDRLAQAMDEEPLVRSLDKLRDRYRRRVVEQAGAFSQLWSEDQRRDYSDRFHAMLVAIDEVAAPAPAASGEVDSSCRNSI
jgi:CHAD domain-containing protein